MSAATELAEALEGEAQCVERRHAGDEELLRSAATLLREQEREIKACHESVDTLRRNLSAVSVKFQELAASDSNRALRAKLHRADALAEAVGGLMHDEDCDNTPCTCGLDDIFAKLAAYEGGGR